MENKVFMKKNSPNVVFYISNPTFRRKHENLIILIALDPNGRIAKRSPWEPKSEQIHENQKILGWGTEPFGL